MARSSCPEDTYGERPLGGAAVQLMMQRTVAFAGPAHRADASLSTGEGQTPRGRAQSRTRFAPVGGDKAGSEDTAAGDDGRAAAGKDCARAAAAARKDG